jgi:hypothetical protein
LASRNGRRRGRRLDHLGEALLLAARLAHAADYLVHQKPDARGKKDERDADLGQVAPVGELAEAVREAAADLSVADPIEQRHGRDDERDERTPPHHRPGQREGAAHADHDRIVHTVAAEKLGEEEREQHHGQQGARKAQVAPARAEHQHDDRRDRNEDLGGKAAVPGEEIVGERDAAAGQKNERREGKQAGLDAELGVPGIFRRNQKLTQPGDHYSLPFRGPPVFRGYGSSTSLL